MRRMLTAVPLLLLTVLAACAGGKEGPGVATAGKGATASASADPSAPAADEEERKRQFTDCMRGAGVDMDDVSTEGGGVAVRTDKREVNEAMEKCRKYLPGGGEPPKLSPADIEKMREYARCMRENGVPTFPDPDPENGTFKGNDSSEGEGEGEMKNMDTANEKCRDKLPAFPEGGGK